MQNLGQTCGVRMAICSTAVLNTDDNILSVTRRSLAISGRRRGRVPVSSAGRLGLTISICRFLFAIVPPFSCRFLPAHSVC